MCFSEDGSQFMKYSLVQWCAMLSIGKKYLLQRTLYLTLQSRLQGLFCSSHLCSLTSLCGFYQGIFSSQEIASEGWKWKMFLRSVLAPYLRGRGVTHLGFLYFLRITFADFLLCLPLPCYFLSYVWSVAKKEGRMSNSLRFMKAVPRSSDQLLHGFKIQPTLYFMQWKE